MNFNPIQLAEMLLKEGEALLMGQPAVLGPVEATEEFNFSGKTYLITEAVTVTVKLKG